jgi:hypothetical protein
MKLATFLLLASSLAMAGTPTPAQVQKFTTARNVTKQVFKETLQELRRIPNNKFQPLDSLYVSAVGKAMAALISQTDILYETLRTEKDLDSLKDLKPEYVQDLGIAAKARVSAAAYARHCLAIVKGLEAMAPSPAAEALWAKAQSSLDGIEESLRDFDNP